MAYFRRKVCLLGAKRIFFSNPRKIFPTKEMHSVVLIKLARKIKAFQLAFEVKDLAANGTCRQVTLLT